MEPEHAHDANESKFRCVGALSELKQALEAKPDATAGEDKQLVDLIRAHGVADSNSEDGIAAWDDLAEELWARWKERNDEMALRACVEIECELLDLHPPGHPQRGWRCADLATSLSSYFDLKTDDSSLDAAIRLGREALELQPPGHPDRANTCGELAAALFVLFERIGDIALLDQAMELEREVLSLRPADHPRRAEACSNYATSLATRWEQNGDSTLLDEAISLERQGLKLRPVGHPYRDESCTQLAGWLIHRFDQTRDDTLLDEALTLEHEGLALRPPGHVDRAVSCMNLAYALGKRFQQTDDSALLDQIIELEREVLRLTPPEHIDRADICRNLASSLWDRYFEVEDEGLLDEVMQLEREALRLWPIGHIHHATGCLQLASSLCERFGMSDGAADTGMLDEASSLLAEAIADRPIGHPERWQCLEQLATLALLKDDSTTAISMLHQVVLSPPYNNIDDVLNQVVEDLDDIDIDELSHSQKQALLTVYRGALGLVTLATGLALDTATQLQHIANGSTLGSGAFTLATLVNDLPTGLELLDHARGVIWSQTLYMRNPDLKHVPDEFAAELTSLLHNMSSSSSRITDTRTHRVGLPPSVLERDLRHSQHGQLQQVLRNIRSLPGLHDFMKGPSVDTLLTTAARGPVVVLVASEDKCHALIIGRDQHLHHLLIEDMDEQTLQGITLAGVASQHRGASPGGTRSERGMRISRMMSSSYKSLAKLWRAVVKPVLAELGLEKAQDRARPRIHWCSTGAFTFVPVHAAGIYEGRNQECCSDYVVSSYTPTLSALLRAQQNPEAFAPAQMKLLAVAVEEAQDSSLPRLPYVLEESHSVLEIASRQGTRSANVEATQAKTEIMASLESTNMVHLACHGIQHSTEPHRSHFCLGSGELTVSELMEMDLKEAFFAFLSACETARGDQKHADEAVHLAATMLFAGFKSVVATMWAMRDEDGPFIAKHFYLTLFKSKMIDLDTIAYALDHAVTALRESGAAPERWATFVHMGA